MITDILVLRRRLPGQAPAGQSWKTTVDLAEQDLNVDAPVWVNQYFLDNPDHVLGTLGVRRGRFGPELTVDSSPSGQPLGERVRQAFTAIAERARSQDLLAVPPAPDTSPLRLVPVGRNHLPDGLLQIAEDGSITRLDRGLPRPYEVKPAKDRVELKALIRLRDTYMDLLDAEEASAEDTDTIRRLRASLNQQYDAYVSRYGPINRFKVDSRGGASSAPSRADSAAIRCRRWSMRWSISTPRPSRPPSPRCSPSGSSPRAGPVSAPIPLPMR